MNATAIVGAQGRVVIPADIRAVLGLVAGDQLVISVRGRSLILERPADAVAELRSLGAAVPDGRSLVEELLADRRAAALSE